MRVLFTLLEINKPYQLHVVDLSKGEHKQPAHLARQPFGKVPAMEDTETGVKMYESRAMCRYILEKYNDTTLIPADLKERALFEQWMSLEATTYTPDVEVLLGQWLAPRFGGTPNEEAKQKALENLIQKGKVLDDQLSTRDFIIGPFSLVDISMFTYMWYERNEPELQKWFSTYPHIGAWFKRTTERPAFQKLVPQLFH